MNWTLLLTRAFLAAVFFAAGIAKLSDLKGSRKAVKEFGLPQWMTSPLGIALPVAEVGTAFLLLPTRSVFIGALCSIALLLMFIAAIGTNMALGRRPKCHCFGQIHSEPVGWPTLLRNAVLASLATFLVLEARKYPGPSVLYAVEGFTLLQIVAIVLGALLLAVSGTLFWLILNLFRQNGRLLLRIETLERDRSLSQRQPSGPGPVVPGLAVGTKAPSFDLPGVGGSRATLESLLAQGTALLLISTDPNCGPCNSLMPDIANWQQHLAAELNVALLSHGRLSDNEAKAAETGIINLLIEKDYEIAEKYHAVGTPTGVLIRKDGTIGSPPAAGPDAIRQLVMKKAWTQSGLAAFMMSLAQPLPTAPPKPLLSMSSQAPAFSLADLYGKTVNSGQFNGNGTMLMFWNPACGFCQQMLPQLNDWEKARQADAPRLVLISSGSREANLQMELDATVLIDEKFSVGQLYGAAGTPSGVLLDSAGQIASGLAVGAVALMELLFAKQQFPSIVKRGSRD